MKNIKAHIYSLLSSDADIISIVGDKIVPSVGLDNKNLDQRLPQLTFGRITGKTSNIGIRVELFQVSCWSKIQDEAETLSQKVISLLNRSSDNFYEKCILDSANDSNDSNTMAFGIHLTLRFVLRDQDY